MSLVRLLTSGRSLVGLKDSVSRYRMREKSLLPKFGSSGNPFAGRSGGTSPAAPGIVVEGQPGSGQMTPAEVAAAQLKETRRLPVIAPNSEAAKTSRPGLAGRVVRCLGQWARNSNPFLRRANQAPSARAAARPGHRPPVQAELSLDKIKVVRNDLSDADVEIVSAREAARLKPAAVTGAGTGVALPAFRRE